MPHRELMGRSFHRVDFIMMFLRKTMASNTVFNQWCHGFLSPPKKTNQKKPWMSVRQKWPLHQLKTRVVCIFSPAVRFCPSHNSKRTVFLIPRQNSYCAAELSEPRRVYDGGDGAPSWCQSARYFSGGGAVQGHWHFLSGSDGGLNFWKIKFEVRPWLALLSSVFPCDLSSKTHSSAMIQRTKVTESPPN